MKCTRTVIEAKAITKPMHSYPKKLTDRPLISNFIFLWLKNHNFLPTANSDSYYNNIPGIVLSSDQI